VAPKLTLTGRRLLRCGARSSRTSNRCEELGGNERRGRWSIGMDGSERIVVINGLWCHGREKSRDGKAGGRGLAGGKGWCQFRWTPAVSSANRKWRASHEQERPTSTAYTTTNQTSHSEGHEQHLACSIPRLTLKGQRSIHICIQVPEIYFTIFADALLRVKSFTLIPQEEFQAPLLIAFQTHPQKPGIPSTPANRNKYRPFHPHKLRLEHSSIYSIRASPRGVP